MAFEWGVIKKKEAPTPEEEAANEAEYLSNKEQHEECERVEAACRNTDRHRYDPLLGCCPHCGMPA